jgi:hypothetical protein
MEARMMHEGHAVGGAMWEEGTLAGWHGLLPLLWPTAGGWSLPLLLLSAQCMIFMVCDGHMGVKCADFVVDHFLGLLRPKLPRKLPNENNPAGACMRW